MQGRILYIEDNDINRERLKYFLKRLNYQMIEADSGRNGITAAYSELPNLILLDTSLPDVKGAEVVKILKSTPELRHIPIVALTLRSDEWEACQQAGCDGHLFKPFGKMQLEDILHLFLEKATA